MNTTAQHSATGKRKNAIARVRLVPGEGKIIVNDRTAEEYFPGQTLVRLIRQPLEVLSLIGKFDVYANIAGGGIAGQAGALRHGIARSLLEVSPEYRRALKSKGFLTRDSREKERKKYGQKGARKKFQYSKR
ncbi:MAG: 30S ribosomal protein S9 [Nitrospirae bacterium]|nr:30S ribosomal protein S9 [Nitrospirota bacterium]